MDTRKRFLAKIIQFWAIHEICMMADFGSRASSSFLLFTICLQRESRKVPFLNHTLVQWENRDLPERTKKLDEAVLYDRQIRLWGLAAQQRQATERAYTLTESSS